jgi:hypothetical protein
LKLEGGFARKIAETEDRVFVECLEDVHDAHTGKYNVGEVYEVTRKMCDQYNAKRKKAPFKVLKDKDEAQKVADKHAEASLRRAKERERATQRRDKSYRGRGSRSPEDKQATPDEDK